jgi:ATP-binding cassette subfamily F protein uup
MRVQKGGARDDKAAPARAKAASRPQASRPARAVKMNFADLHALKTLPEQIAVAEVRMAELEQGLSDAGLYARDPVRFNDLSAELARLRTQKDADEERWLALEMQREALEQPD